MTDGSHNHPQYATVSYVNALAARVAALQARLDDVPTPTPTPTPGTTYGGGPTGTLAAYTGPTTITTPTTIQNVRITQPLDIRAAVTMKNVDVKATTGWAVIRMYPEGSLNISDFRIDGTGSDQNSGGLIGDNITARRGEIFGVENGIVGGSNHLIEDVYIHDLAMVGSAHPDGVQYDGGNKNIVLRRCHIAVKQFDTAAVMIDNYYGASSGITLDSCQLSGGGYTLYLEGQFGSAAISGVTLINNTFSGWGYGPVLRRGPGPITVASQSGNTAAGIPLTI